MADLLITRMGWLPDYPDFRDYSVLSDKVAPRLKLLGQKIQ